MKLIVGLGNPGKEYSKTRHNVGFMVIDNIVNNLNLTFEKKLGGLYFNTIINGEKVIFLKPQLFINVSGEVVRSFVDYFKINIEDILIISDDVDMEVGSFKLKANGSSGGHNGLKNIEQYLSTQNYKRLKIGVSKNKDRDTRDHVLGIFSTEEKKIIEEVIIKSEEIIIDFIKTDFFSLMNKYNGLK